MDEPGKKTGEEKGVDTPVDEKPHVTVKLKRERRVRAKEATQEAPPEAASPLPTAATEPANPASKRDDDAPSSEGWPIADPKRWDRYELLGLLGRGGMGAVYKARDRRLDRYVAIKFIHGADPLTTKRFLQEARAQARLDHPNVCKVLEVGEVEGKAYIAMQLIEGESLTPKARSMTLDERVRIIKTVTDAVHAAHRLGIVHRDIKPANIMLEETKSADGSIAIRPVLMDFGLAREESDTQGLTESGAIMGTPGFMPPEQARGDVRNVDARSDVYSLGATLYDLLVGEPPFVADTAVNILLKVLIQEPTPLRMKDPSIPQALDIIVGKCLNKEPHQRYTTAAELADDLERFLNRERVLARRLSLPTRLYWRGKRNKPMAFAVLALVSSLIAFAGYGVRTVIVNARQEAIAQRRAELGQRLGQAVKDLDWLVRSAYLVPLHDTGPEKAAVRARMTEIEAEMRSFGDLAAGLDHYAIGRGHVALKEWDRAETELLQAENLGVRDPELDYALGRVLGELYSRGLEDARKSGDKSYFEKIEKELSTKYLEPALLHLERCRGLPTVPANYLEGLIHFYHHRYPEALASGRAASDQITWLYEAEKLEGDVFMARALDAKDQGQNDEAEAQFVDAIKHYEKAADIGRSDHQVYEALAEAWIRQEELDLFRGRDPKPKLEKALKAAENALKAAPSESDGQTKIAFSYFFYARFAKLHGAPQAEVERLFQAQIDAGKQAIALHPKDAFAREATGIAYLNFAESLQDRGQPAELLLTEARGHFEEAIRLNARFPWAYNDYGYALALAGISKKRRNEDPHELLQRAIASAQKAFEIDDGYLIAYNNAAAYLTELGQWDEDHGANPEISLREAVQMTDLVLRVNDKHLLAYGTSGSAFTKIAEYRLDAGADGREPAQQSIDKFRALLQVDPSFALAWRDLGRAYRLLASHERVHGVGSSTSLDEGGRALARCYGLEAGNGLCKIAEAELLAEQALWAEKQGQPFLPLFEQAQKRAQEGTQKLPERSEGWLVLGEICLRRAETLRSLGEPEAQMRGVVEEGLRAIKKALALAPGLPRALAIEGTLYLHQSEIAQTLENNALEHAQASLSQAFEGNALLKRGYGEAAAEVDRRIKRREGRE